MNLAYATQRPCIREVGLAASYGRPDPPSGSQAGGERKRKKALFFRSGPRGRPASFSAQKGIDSEKFPVKSEDLDPHGQHYEIPKESNGTQLFPGPKTPAIDLRSPDNIDRDADDKADQEDKQDQTAAAREESQNQEEACDHLGPGENEGKKIYQEGRENAIVCYIFGKPHRMQNFIPAGHYKQGAQYDPQDRAEVRTL